MARLNKNHNHASLVSSIEEGIKLQKQSRSKQIKLPNEDCIGNGMTNLAISGNPSDATPGIAYYLNVFSVNI